MHVKQIVAASILTNRVRECFTVNKGCLLSCGKPTVLNDRKKN